MYNKIRALKYHTVGTAQKSNRKIPHCQNSSKIQLKNTTLSEQLKNPTEKSHTVRTAQKSNRKIVYQGTIDISNTNT
jgi:hypothetical protein